MPGFSFVVIISAVVKLLSRNSSITKCLSVVGFEPNGFVVISNGAVQVAFVRIGISAAVKRRRIVRVEPYRLVEVRDGFIKATRRVSRITFSDRV